jgi:hypothetical protein
MLLPMIQLRFLPTLLTKRKVEAAAEAEVEVALEEQEKPIAEDANADDTVPVAAGMRH